MSKLLYKINSDMSKEDFACRIMNLKEKKNKIDTLSICNNILQQYKIFNYVRIIKSKVKSINDFHNNWLPNLNFNINNNFELGQRASEIKHHKYVTNDKLIRRLDFYNNNFYLLPNNEVAYLKNTPENVIFYCNKKAKKGGRTFIHSVIDIENEILKQKNGEELLKKYELRGISLEFGYLDKNHPMQKNLYTPSWQEKFETNDINIALNKCKINKDIDYVYIKNDNNYDILITRTLLPGYIYSKNIKYFRPPRIAITNPSIENGFRRFTFGPTNKDNNLLNNYNNYETFSKDEINIFIKAFLNTRQGTEWEEKDFIIFNNITHCHSKESYIGDLDLFVCMSNKINVNNPYLEFDLNNIENNPPVGIDINKKKDNCCYWGYTIPLDEANKKMWNDYISMMAFDAKKNINKNTIKTIKLEAKKYGHLHIYNSGLINKNIDKFKNNIDNLVKNLNFNKKTTYPYGGSKSGRTPRVSISKKTKSVDKYPSELFLLPHNEILYQHALPKQLFFCGLNPTNFGGRTFSHSAILFERILKSNKDGLKLYNLIKKKGFTIKTGFVSKYEPEKYKNFLVSWEDRFSVPKNKRIEELNKLVKSYSKIKNKNYNLNEYLNEKLIKYNKIFPIYFNNITIKEKFIRIENMILAKHLLCIKSIDKFDKCEWKKNKESGYPYLYTTINIESFKKDLYNKNIEYLFFPRIQYTNPEFENGFRDFSIGNYKLTVKDINILLKSYWLTREGLNYNKGDFQIIDNIKYSHSRESYIDNSSKNKRIIVVAMGGTFFTDKLIKINKEIHYINKIKSSYPKYNIYNEETIYA
jgi:hypothetical protein